MRKISMLLSLVVILSLLLAACVGAAEEEPTPGVIDTPALETELPDTGLTDTETAEVTVAVTEPEAPTLDVTETTGVTITETPGAAETVLPGPGVETTPGAVFPPLGFADPSRLTTLMTFDVRNANGDTLANVDNMVIDLQNSNVLHVILASGGFLGIGESLIPVPWNVMEVNPACVTAAMGTGAGATGGTGDTTGGAAVTGTPGAGATTGGTETPAAGGTTGGTAAGTETPEAGGATGDTGAEVSADDCYFLLNLDDDALRNAPNVELDNLPDINTPGWDAEFKTYWSTAAGGTTGGTAAGTETPAAGGAAGTATPEAGGAGGAAGTATPGTEGTGGTAGSGRLILADDLLGMPVVAGTTGAGGTTGGTAAGTETPAAGGAAGTETPAAGGAAGTETPEAGTGGTAAEGETLGFVTDAIVDLQTGDIRYFLVTADAAMETAGALIPVPAQAFSMGAGTEGAEMFTLNVDQSVLVGAPSFDEGTFPNATMQGWDAELNTYWQNEGFGTTTTP